MQYIRSWGLSLLAALGLAQPGAVSSINQNSYRVGVTRIVLVQGDIVNQNVDVIVNAANEKLSGPMGNAVIASASILKRRGIKNIIYTTGPRGDTPKKEELLRDVYMNSLQLAADNGLKSIAFPAISTGSALGYDINAATPIACACVKHFITKHHYVFDEVRFVVFSDSDYAVYKKYMDMFFGK